MKKKRSKEKDDHDDTPLTIHNRFQQEGDCSDY